MGPVKRQFALRTLLAVVAVVCVILAVARWEQKRWARVRDLEQRLSALGADWLFVAAPFLRPQATRLVLSGDELDDAEQTALQTCLHDAAELCDVRSLSVIRLPLEESDYLAIGRMKRLHTLSLYEVGLDDGDLQALTTCQQLRRIDLGFPDIDEAGVAALAEFPYLTHLGLSAHSVSEFDLDDLRQLRPELDVQDD